MDFKLPENTTMIADTAKRYLKDNYSFDTYRKQLAEARHINDSRWHTMKELGWFGLPFPESLGGYQGSLLDVAMIVRELGASLCLDPYVDLIVAPGKLLEFIQTPASLALLANIIEGNGRIACALYDQHAGYQAEVPSPILSRNRLSGQKHLVPDGGCADHYLVTVRDANALAIVLLPASFCHIERYRALDGSRVASLTFDDVEIDDDMILSRGTAATDALSRLIDYLRALDCARMYGAVQALYQNTLEYAKTRKQFGVAIGSFQVIQHYLVDMFIDLQQLESMLLMVLVKADQQEESERARATSAAKIYYAEWAVRIAQMGIQIHGGVGVTEELNIGHYFRQITHGALSHGNGDFHVDRFISLATEHAA